MTDSEILDKLCLMLDSSRQTLVSKVQFLQIMNSAFLDKPEDRLFHAADKTWWKRIGNQIVRADPPNVI